MLCFSCFAAEKNVTDKDFCVNQLKQFDQFLMSYYTNPQPDKFVPMDNLMSKCGGYDLYQQKSMKYRLGEYHAPLIFFNARIFAQNPDKILRWMGEINFTSEYQRQILYSALWESGTNVGAKYLEQVASSVDGAGMQIAKNVMSEPRVDLMHDKLNPDVLDGLWASFFATGESKYVERIVSVLSWDLEAIKNKPSSDEKTMELLTYGAAAWSLRSVMEQDPNVMKICKKQLPKLNLNGKKALNKLIDDAQSNTAN